MASTVATLLFLPAIFAVVIGEKEPTSPSLYPGNPQGAQFSDPELGSGGNGGEGENLNGGGSADQAEGG